MNARRQQAKFLYRYFTRTHGWRDLLKLRVFLVVVALVVFLAGLTWTPFSAQGLDPTATPTASSAALTTPDPVLPTRTPFPEEFIENGQQTVGITFAGAILVLIVVIGVVAFLPRSIDSGQAK